MAAPVDPVADLREQITKIEEILIDLRKRVRDAVC